MKKLQEAHVPYNSGWAGELKSGQVIRIIATTTVDFVCMKRDNLKERFDQARTKVYNMKIFITIGDKRTRKKDVLDRIFRQDLTKEAIKRIQKKHGDGADLGIDVEDEARLGEVEGLDLSRKSMEAKRAAEAKKPKKSLDLRRTNMGASDLLQGDADRVDGRGVTEDKLGGVGLSNAEGKRLSVDHKGRGSLLPSDSETTPEQSGSGSRRGGHQPFDEA